MDPAGRKRSHGVPGGAFLGGATLVVLVFAWLALDDITTDNSSGFLPEYRLLMAAGAWCAFVASALLKKGSSALGLISLAAVAAAAVVAFQGIGHVRDGGWSVFWPEYSIVLAAWLWFFVLSAMLLARGLRPRPLEHVGPA